MVGSDTIERPAMLPEYTVGDSQHFVNFVRKENYHKKVESLYVNGIDLF
jgi:hypothetical protein